MKSAVLSLGLATLVAAAEKRHEADASNFHSAADELISKYLEPQWDQLSATFAAAASSAGVSGPVESLVYSALQAAPTDRPGWFQQAIPAEHSDNVLALESSIDLLRTGAPVVVVVTTTNTAGETVTNTITSTGLVAAPVTTVETAVITTTDSAGSTITTGVPTTVTKSPTTSDEEDTATSTSSSSGLGAMPTAFGQGAAGVAALVGLAMAL